ncbi:MAG: LytR/AlgR family response regulator transcription factor [Chryseotalea sp.]
MSEKIEAIIVDDELSGREGLKILVDRHCPKISIVDVCDNLEAAISTIKSKKPRLVFLDIEINERYGFELFNYFDQIDFKVIFVSAFDKYAIKAIKLNALDYLLKPVNAEDLNKAVTKLEEAGWAPTNNQLINNLKRNNFDKIAVPTREGYSFIDLSEIIRCEADINYSVIHLKTGLKVVSSKSLGEYEQLLDTMGFLRIHKSHIINLDHIKSYIKGDGGVIIMADGAHIPVSRRQRDEFLNRLNFPGKDF